MESLNDRIASLLDIRWHNRAEIAEADHEAVSACILAILRDPAFIALPIEATRPLVEHIVALYAGSWHRSALLVAEALDAALMLARPGTTLDDACQLYDALLLLYWCAAASMADQRGFGPRVVEPFANFVGAMPRLGGMAPTLRHGAKPLRIVYLSQFAAAGDGNAHLPVAEHVLCSLAQHLPQRYRLSLYAWMFHDDTTDTAFAPHGIAVRRFAPAPAAARIAAVASALRKDGVDILITDMNSSLPTVLFEQRVAPVQIYYQLGMPFWPVRNIDHIFRVWASDPRAMGFDPAICSTLNGPWVASEYAAPRDPTLVARERVRMPVGRRLFGCYGRLAKITPAYLDIIATLLGRHPDIAVVIGGSGDAAPIRAFAAARGLPAERFALFDEYVDGHVWGRLLDVFLDTFPQQGGASCREMIAKGGPVVSAVSPDMPNLAQERVASLTAADPAAYLAIASRLAGDDEFLDQARAETRALFARMPTRADYAATIDAGITQVLARQPATRLQGLIDRALHFLEW